MVGLLCGSTIMGFISDKYGRVTGTFYQYRTRAIISRGLYIFYPISKGHLCTVTFGLMYDLYSRAASNQERPMMARLRYVLCSVFLLSSTGLTT